MFSKGQKIGLLAGLIIFLAFLIIPFDGITPASRRMAGIAILMAIWWIFEVIPLAITALLPIPLYPLLKIMPSSKVAVNYTNHLLFLFIGGFMLAAAIQKWNLHKRIALTIIRIIGTEPHRILMGFMLATAFLAMWISNTATAMMILPIAMAVVNQMSLNVSIAGVSGDGGQEELFKQTFGMTLMLGIAYSASVGGVGTLIGTPPNIVFAGFIRNIFPASPEIGFSQWMFIGLPVVITLLPIIWFLLAFVMPKRKFSDFEFGHSATKDVIAEEIRKLGPLSKGEKLTSAVFIITVFLWMFRIPINIGVLTIPGWSTVFSAEHASYFHDATVAMAMAILLFLLPVDRKNKRFVLDWPTARSFVPWGIVLLFGGGFALAAGFNQTGLDQFIASHLGLLKGLPIIAIIFAVCFLMTFLTEVTSNTATATMILPILAATSGALGKNPLLLMIPATISASCAFMLPVATPPNAIVFGSGWVNITKMARTGLILNLIGAIIVTIICYFLIPLIFSINPSSMPSWAIP